MKFYIEIHFRKPIFFFWTKVHMLSDFNSACVIDSFYNNIYKNGHVFFSIWCPALV